MKTPDGKTFTPEAEPSDTTAIVREKTTDPYGEKPEKLRHIFAGKLPENNRTPADYNTGTEDHAGGAFFCILRRLIRSRRSAQDMGIR